MAAAPTQVSNIVIANVGSDGGETQEAQDPGADVPPKAMAEAIKELKMRFGNVDEQCECSAPLMSSVNAAPPLMRSVDAAPP